MRFIRIVLLLLLLLLLLLKTQQFKGLFVIYYTMNQPFMENQTQENLLVKYLFHCLKVLMSSQSYFMYKSTFFVSGYLLSCRVTYLSSLETQNGSL